MTALWSLCAVVCLAQPSAPALEAEGRAYLLKSFERVGRRTPAVDPALEKAARGLATRALHSGARAAADPVTITEALSAQGAWEPNPKVLVIRGSPPEEPLQRLRAKDDLAAEPATHVGVGVAVGAGRAALVVLSARRKVQLSTLPSPTPALGTQRLCGQLVPPLGTPEVFVTVPDGRVEKVTVTRQGEGFCARLKLGKPGRHTVEVLGRGAAGPEVAALFFSDVGGEVGPGHSGLGPEPQGPKASRQAVLERINALRAAHQVAPLTLDPKASEVAQAYSARMAKGRFFAHLSPEGQSVGARLREAGYVFRSVGENLGLAEGPLAAQFGIEHSPGHRRNLLDPAFTHLGLGLARRQDGQYVLTQILVAPAGRPGADPLDEAYRAIGRRRGELKLPAMRRDGRLEALAKAHAASAFQAADPRADLPGSKLHARIFAAADEVKTASVDLFIADHPGLLAPSASLDDSSFDRVGVGFVRGDSARFGRGKYWVVIIYAKTR